MPPRKKITGKAVAPDTDARVTRSAGTREPRSVKKVVSDEESDEDEKFLSKVAIPNKRSKTTKPSSNDTQPDDVVEMTGNCESAAVKSIDKDSVMQAEDESVVLESVQKIEDVQSEKKEENMEHMMFHDPWVTLKNEKEFTKNGCRNLPVTLIEKAIEYQNMIAYNEQMNSILANKNGESKSTGAEKMVTKHEYTTREDLSLRSHSSDRIEFTQGRRAQYDNAETDDNDDRLLNDLCYDDTGRKFIYNHIEHEKRDAFVNVDMDKIYNYIMNTPMNFLPDMPRYFEIFEKAGLNQAEDLKKYLQSSPPLKEFLVAIMIHTVSSYTNQLDVMQVLREIQKTLKETNYSTTLSIEQRENLIAIVKEESFQLPDTINFARLITSAYYEELTVRLLPIALRENQNAIKALLPAVGREGYETVRRVKQRLIFWFSKPDKWASANTFFRDNNLDAKRRWWYMRAYYCHYPDHKECNWVNTENEMKETKSFPPSFELYSNVVRKCKLKSRISTFANDLGVECSEDDLRKLIMELRNIPMMSQNE